MGAGTNSEARAIELPLSFLKPGVEYMAEIYADVEAAPEKIAIERRKVTATDSLTIRMASAGGQAISFIPVEL